MRIGTGWDLHRLVEGRRLVIGGVDIPAPFGEEGHSDGDALVHAVIDALFGAVGDGDIGSHYPDTDPKYRGISSLVLLADARSRLGSFGIVNLDTTVILQAPKLRPYIDPIRLSLARTLDIDPSRVSVKAKTTEHLLEHAIIAQAAVLLA